MAMVDRLLYLENAIKLHEHVDNRLGDFTSKACYGTPFMTVQKLLEGKKYLTVSLFIPYIRDLRGGLDHALNYLKLPTPVDGPVKIAEKKAVIPYVDTLIEDSISVGGAVRASSCTGKGRGDIGKESGSSRS